MYKNILIGALFCLSVTGCTDPNVEIRKTVQYQIAKEIFEPWDAKYQLNFCGNQDVFITVLKDEIRGRTESKFPDNSPEMIQALKLLYEDKCR
jgi:7-cyano-7-deazaguanine synthase in queuosine biosynthesis